MPAFTLLNPHRLPCTNWFQGVAELGVQEFTTNTGIEKEYIFHPLTQCLNLGRLNATSC